MHYLLDAEAPGQRRSLIEDNKLDCLDVNQAPVWCLAVAVTHIHLVGYEKQNLAGRYWIEDDMTACQGVNRARVFGNLVAVTGAGEEG